MTSVTITTGARLHFGPLSVSAPAGGKFGGVGVMIQSPSTILTARIAQVDSVVGEEKSAKRVAEFLSRIRNALPTETLPACEISVKQTIPAHCGFGSGTQLGLAVARLTSALLSEPEPTPEALARRAGRGLRSAIGLYGFHRGGFLVDGGRAEPNQLGTLVARVDFPTEWRFVLAAPKRTAGLSGEAEQLAFASQPPMPTILTGELCRIVLMEWLPAVIESDFSRCSESMFQFGHAVGEFFSKAQGGVFADRRMSDWANLLRRRGIQGVAQTSWGPTVAALCANDKQAQQMKLDFARDSAWNDCSFQVVSPLNQGAAVSGITVPPV